MPGEGRRRDLRDFLASKRARVTPASAGLPAGGRRRTPGLRREEVAVLAGVSPTWYQWLEQGRAINVSPQVLDAVARVLCLDEVERRHLYVLAGLNPPPPAGRTHAYCEGLQRLIEAWDPKPATMLDASWNHVAWNQSAGLALSMAQADRNCLMGFFHDPRFRRRERAWRDLAPTVVAAFRAAAAEHPCDHDVHDVVSTLTGTSPDFARLWARQDVQAAGIWINEVDHPVVGTLSFESSQMRLPARPDLTVMLYNPLPGTDTADKIAWLRSTTEDLAG
ncbi:helix-turn-helix transcriptional regulator [Nonomuraea rubra]|uniref:helix-turn-helix transcriptional regulator n=1 Tax=Nonomuraea rubra TaxID=46180 RepID=UPI0033CA6878